MQQMQQEELIFNKKIEQFRLESANKVFEFVDEDLIGEKIMTKVVCIWIDEQIGNEENQIQLRKLSKKFTQFQSYSEVKQAQNFVQQLTRDFYDTKQIFLLVSGKLAIKSIQQFAEKSFQISKIFIFNKEDVEQELQSSKIVYISNKFDEILEAMEREYKISEYIDLLEKSAIHFHDHQNFIKFICVDFVIKLAIDKSISFDQAYSDLEEFSNEYIKQNYDNVHERKQQNLRQQYLQLIRDDKNLNDTKAIYWFTKESFVYKMINSTIRKGNILHIYQIRLAINKLYQDINKLQKKQTNLEVLYRGTVIHKNEIELWKGGRIPLMMLGFNSTTSDIQVATKFLKKNLNESLINVMIQFEIKQNQDNKPVDISLISEFQFEKEFLMQLNTFLIVNEVIFEQQSLKVIAEIISFNELKNLCLDQNQIFAYKINREQFLLYDQIMNQKKYELDEFSFIATIQKMGFHKEVVTFLEKKLLKMEDKFEAMKNYFLAISLCRLEFFDKALEIMMISLEIRNKIFGQQHCDTADSYWGVGYIYYFSGKYNDALKFLFSSLQIRLKIFNDSHPDVAYSYNTLGVTFFQLGNFVEALKYYENALKIRINLPFNEDNIASSLSNIGATYSTLRNYKEALQYFQNSLKIRKQIFGEYHIDTAQSYHNIGMTYSFINNYEEALEYYKKSLQIKIKVFGDNHSEVAEAFLSIGSTYDKLSEFEEGLQYKLKSLDIFLKIYGEQHSTTARSYNNLGASYQNIGNYSQALVYYIKSYKIKKQFFGEQHIEIATSLYNLSNIYRLINDYERALEFAFKSLQIRENILGNHPDTAESYSNIASVYVNIKDYKQAFKFQEKSFLIFSQNYGSNHPKTITSQIYLKKIKEMLTKK